MIFTEICRGGRHGTGRRDQLVAITARRLTARLFIDPWQVDSDKEQPNVRWGCRGVFVSFSLRKGGWTTENWRFFFLFFNGFFTGVLLVFFAEYKMAPIPTWGRKGKDFIS